MKQIILFAFLFLAEKTFAQTASKKAFCNPMNLDYGYTPIPNLSEWGRHRATADPVIVNYRGTYFLFSTNQWGYWHSPDLSDWTFVPRLFLRPRNKVYDELCAPAVGIVGDTMLVLGSSYARDFTLWISTDPKNPDSWQPAVENFDIGGWDPAFFTDPDDGRFYMYNGSSNRWPLYGIELDRRTFEPKGTRKEVFGLQSWRYGWQRFGEHLDDTFLDAFVEGAWMTKHDGRFYLQYGAPGTEFSHYADGVSVSKNPLDFFESQSDPLSLKMGGFANGAGHGATFQDNWGSYWHISTIRISVKNNFERRNGLWPAGFDKDGVMFCNTAFGDWPHFLPDGKADHLESRFTGWMLLNFQKPVRASSSLGGHAPNLAVDEDIRTHWSAKTGNAGEFFETDLGEISTVRAVQINYADQDADSAFLGKKAGISHQYRLFSSLDGQKWQLLVDKSRNQKDVPHDFVQLEKAVEARFLKIENVKMPTGKFALSGLRVFGLGHGEKPPAPREFMVLRTEKDPRSAWLRWSPVDQAFAYNIYYGTAPDKLYTCFMVMGANEYWLKTLDREADYFFQIESINENGASKRSEIKKVER